MCLPYRGRPEKTPLWSEWRAWPGEAVAGHFFCDLEEFAAYAAMLVRTWFLDQSMGMHPHLAYAAAVPGRCDGDHRGITEGVPLLWVLDGAGLLEESRSWSCLLYTSPSPRDATRSRMPSSA